MVAFSSIKPGDVLWERSRRRLGNTTGSAVAEFSVKVVEVDVEGERALCSWNDNPARWYRARSIEKFRRNRMKKPT